MSCRCGRQLIIVKKILDEFKELDEELAD